MFKCEKCGKTTRAGEKQHKKVVETREKTYTNLDIYGNKKTSKGWEIVKEMNICEECSKNEED